MGAKAKFHPIEMEPKYDERSQIPMVNRSVLIAMLSTQAASAQLEPKCVENSSERHGGIGCSYVANKELSGHLREPLYWHPDRFDDGEKARAAAGPDSVAFDGHGAWWLLSVESTVDNHHGGAHVSQVLLPPLPTAAKYSMLVISSFIPAGMTSRVHHHSGVEAFYVVDGEQCLETPSRAYPVKKGDVLVLPTGVTMQMVVTGATPRRALAAVIYDAAQPPTTPSEMRRPLWLASRLPNCKPA
jgi:quercetin dioxygenase-like cupin family protein